MMDQAPNVVTEDGMRSLLAQGYLIEVVCREGAEKRHNRGLMPEGAESYAKE